LKHKVVYFTLTGGTAKRGEEMLGTHVPLFGGEGLYPWGATETWSGAPDGHVFFLDNRVNGRPCEGGWVPGCHI